jgi:1-acyl-sn-glycerol-3-phosphate acyltransferase
VGHFSNVPVFFGDLARWKRAPHVFQQAAKRPSGNWLAEFLPPGLHPKGPAGKLAGDSHCSTSHPTTTEYSSMAQRTFINRIWYQFVRISIRISGVIIYRLKRTGMENIPSEGTVLLVANHQSHLDPPLIGSCSRRRMNYMARSNLFKFAPFGWYISSIDAYPIDLDGSRLSGIRETLRRLKRKEMVLVFPEGARTFDGEMGEFKPGFVALAIRSKATILPVAIEGAFDAWPRTKRFPWFGRIQVHFGEPIPPEDVAEQDEDELMQLVEQKVRECHAVLCSRPVFAKRHSQ